MTGGPKIGNPVTEINGGHGLEVWSPWTRVPGRKHNYRSPTTKK